MREISPYGFTAEAAADRQTASSLVGERTAKVTTNAVGGPAFLSTAPYIPPRSRKRNYCKGKNDTCRAHPVAGSDYCIFHAPGDTE